MQTAMVIVIVAASAVLGWYLTNEQIPQKFARLILETTAERGGTEPRLARQPRESSTREAPVSHSAASVLRCAGRRGCPAGPVGRMSVSQQ